MITDIQYFLGELGLTEKEIEIYLSSLRHGSQTASTLSKKTGIARSTVHFLLDQLMQKGFSSKEVREKTTYYTVVEPEAIEYMLLQKNVEVKKQMEDFQALLPSLQHLKNRGTLLPKVSYYSGLESLYRTIDDCCQEDESVLFVSSHSNMHPKIRQYVEKIYLPKSKKHLHKNKMIVSDGEQARKYLKKAEGVYDEVIFVDPQHNPFKLTLAVHGNKVNFISYDPMDLSGVIIENALVADHMRVMFDILKKYFE